MSAPQPAWMSMALVFAAVGLGLWAGRELALSSASPAPIPMSCGRAMLEGAPGAWVHLTGCELAIDQAVHFDPDHPRALYIPLRSDGVQRLTRVGLRTTDPAIIAVYAEAQQAEAQGSAAIEAWVRANLARLRPVKDVTGLTLAPDDRNAVEFAAVAPGMADEVLVVDENTAPRPRHAWGAIAAAALLLALAGWLRRARRGPIATRGRADD